MPFYAQTDDRLLYESDVAIDMFEVKYKSFGGKALCDFVIDINNNFDIIK